MSSESAQPVPHAVSRRGLLTGAAAIAGAVAAAPLLAACGSSGSKGPGTTSTGDLNKILPNYIPNTSVKPDVRRVAGPFETSS